MSKLLIRFLSDENSTNWFQVNLLFENEEVCYYNLVINDDKDEYHFSQNVRGGEWYNFDVNKFFKYKVELLKFDGKKINVIEREIFHINKHNFNIILRSDDPLDIKIWKFYLWLLQIKYNYRFNIIENEYPDQTYEDFVEISRYSYDKYLKKSEEPLTDDYSSITIISKLFGIVDDDSEIRNHPWLVEYVS